MRNARHQVAAALAIAVAAWLLLSDGQGTGHRAADAHAASGTPADDAGRSAPSPTAGAGDNILFRPVQRWASPADPAGDRVPVTVSREAALAAARTGSLTVVLPDGTRYPVRHERSESAPGGNWTFFGRVDTPLGAQASVITFGRDGVFGTLPAPDGSMLKFTTRAGQAFLQPAGWSVPPGVDPSQHPDYVMPSARATASAARAASVAIAPRVVGQQASEAGGEVTITILAAYTRNLSQLRGSAAAARTEYTNLVAVMNQAHVDSGSRARFQIAGFVELAYPATAWNDAARADIIANTLPDGTDLHGLRDQLAADLVALIRPYVEGDLTCGISQFPGPELQARALSPGTGFSVTAVEACAPLVYAHEIGHNLGLMHDRDTVVGPRGATLSYGAYPFSFGHRQLGPPGFATIMAYDSESRPRLGYFSHPGTTLCGGVACGDPQLADNVRSINLIAGSIAHFRDPPGVFVMDDRWVGEYEDMEGWVAYMPVRLSSPAPAGGVTFDIEIQAGSAQAGVDFDPPPAAELTGIFLAPGQMTHHVGIRILSDAIPEPPETISVRLKNVQGNVAVPDGEATMTILDRSEEVRVAGKVRFPPGSTLPASVLVRGYQFHEGLDAGDAWFEAMAPDFRYSLDIVKGALVSLQVDSAQWMPEVVVEQAGTAVHGVDLRPRQPVVLSGRLEAGGQPVPGVPVLLWNLRGDGAGSYINWSSSSYGASYSAEVLPGTAMQLEVRHPPAPYVRQVIEVPPLLAASSITVPLRTVPSLTIPHSTVAEGTAADGARTVLLTASLSVPRSRTGVTFDVALAGTADAADFHLPTTRFTIPRLRSRVEVPVVIVGDDRREPDETIELRITNIQGEAWNPGPGSLRIATDDGRPGTGQCAAPAGPGAVRMCE